MPPRDGGGEVKRDRSGLYALRSLLFGKEVKAMCGYHCPFAERKPCAGFLLCRDMYKEGVNYTKLLANENKELAESLEIKQAPTLVMVKNGEVAKFAGVSDIKKVLKA